MENASCHCRSQCCSRKDPVIAVDEIHRFAKECLCAVELPEDQADLMACMLAENDQQGMHSCGLISLEYYMNDIKNGFIETKKRPKILKQTSATAWVDGANCLGVVVANFCMNLAIKKAKKVGVAWVVCKGSNQFCSGRFYSTKAMKEGLIGFVCSNGVPVIPPTGSKQPALGSNPLSIAAPPQDEGPVIDLSSSKITEDKVKMASLDKKQVPSQTVMDSNGNLTTSPEEAAVFLPVGWPGFEQKGIGLALMVEIFSGILSGGNYGPELVSNEAGKPPNLSQCFVALNPDCFAPCFPCRMADLMTQIRQVEPDDANGTISLPGDLEKTHMRKTDERLGVRFSKQAMDEFLKLSQMYAIPPLRNLRGLRALRKGI